MKSKIQNIFTTKEHIAPLVVFRIVFGIIMFLSMIRFMLKGWVTELYVEPQLYFPYFGFEWVKPLGEVGMYVLFTLLSVSFLFQALGLFYRIASVFSFLAFTYIELIDKTNYLNHYYFVSLVCLLLIFVPAHRYFSIDVKKNPSLQRTHLPKWISLIFKLQLAIVYFYAGMAKINYDWLINSMPLKIWLPAKSHLPIIGTILKEEWVAYAFSWGGALYDISIPFLLFYRPSRWLAYLLVIVFHLLTYLLFNIGMFPFIMIGATLIFFSVDFHKGILNKLHRLLSLKKTSAEAQNQFFHPKKGKAWKVALGLFFLIQLSLPFRYLAYPGNLFWTEEGYRFSWRVMLMEKAGYAIFHVKDTENNRKWEVNNYDFLTPNQEKMMSTQPDMILQFAHFLEDHYQEKGIKDPIITVESYVSLNGSLSQPFIDPSVDLTEIEEGFAHKSWILAKNEGAK